MTKMESPNLWIEACIEVFGPEWDRQLLELKKQGVIFDGSISEVSDNDQPVKVPSILLQSLLLLLHMI